MNLPNHSALYSLIKLSFLIAIACVFLSGCGATSKYSDFRLDKNVLSHKHAKLREQQVSNVHYRLSLNIEQQATTFSGTQAITFDLASDNTQPLTVDFEEGQINRLSVNEKTIQANYTRHFILIPPEHLVPGQNTIVIDYEREFSFDGTGFHKRIEPDSGDIYLYSDFQSYNANRMFPAFDQPDLKATFTLDVKAPAPWQLISTTLENKIDDLGKQKHWHFATTAKIATYVFSLHAGPYHMWQDNSGKYPLRLFARKQVAEDVDAKFWFDATHKSLAFFEQYFDIPYPYIKYDQILVPDYNAGAMENVAAVTFNEDDFVLEGAEMDKALKDDLLDTIAHEAAHMWFGNLVTMKWWNGLWLNESFASYMAVLAMEKALGLDDAWDTFNGNFKRWGYRSDERVTTHPIELPVADTDIADSIFDGITYGKGSAVVAQLTHFIGPDAFQQGVRNYLKKHLNGNTVLEDFTSELAKAANKDMTRWTQDWLFKAGFNRLHSEIHCDDGLITDATVYQHPDKVDQVIREHKVQVGFYYLEEGEVVQSNSFELLIDDKITKIEEAIGEVCPPFVYSNAEDWGYLRVDLQPQSLLFLQKHLGQFEDQKMRLMIWQDLWSKVKHATLPIADFIKLAEMHLASENNENVKRLVNRSIKQAFEWLAQMPTNKSASLMQRIEQLAWQQASKGSDKEQQLAGFNLFVEVAHSPSGLELVRQMVLGKQQLPDLALRQDQRWALIAQLNRFEYSDYKKLTHDEFKIDPDDDENHIARLIQPNQQAKKQWLDTFMHKPDSIKLDTARYLMNSIFPAEQGKLYGQYQQRLIDALPDLVESTNTLYQSVYTRRMIVGNCTEQSVNRLADAIERYNDLNPAIHDIIRLAHQRDERCFNISKKMN